MNKKHFRWVCLILFIVTILGPFALMFGNYYISWILGIDLDRLETDFHYGFVNRQIIAANAMRLLALFVLISIALLITSTVSLSLQHRNLLPVWISIPAAILSLGFLCFYGMIYISFQLAGAICC